jgi:putative ABC transport system permease protein
MAAPRARLWLRLVAVEAPRALLRYRARTLLAAIGIAIGVAAVVWVVAIGQEGTARAMAEYRRLGDNLVWIEAGSRTVNGLRVGSHGTSSLTPEDAEAIRREIPHLTRVSENVDGAVQVASAEANWNTRWRGVGPEFPEIRAWPVAEGSFFTEDQVRRGESVVVLGETVRRKLFGSNPPLGRLVRVRGFPYQVVGVLAPKGQSSFGSDLDDTVVVPWTTAQRRIRGGRATWLDDVLASASSMEAVDEAARDVKELLRQRHGIRAGEEDDFNVRRPDEVIRAQIEASRTLATVLVMFASISLLVGGIGIMNVMLASVTARTREIGVRLAVGSTAGEVRLQFLGEAVLLCVLGGLAGIPLALVGAVPIGGLIGWTLHPSPSAASLAVSVAAAVGVASGLYPAWIASRLDPIAVLRVE